MTIKKGSLLLVLFFAIIVLTAYSKTAGNKIAKTPENSTYIYCELVQQDIYIVTDVRTTMFLNFGTKSTYKNRVEESNYVKM